MLNLWHFWFEMWRKPTVNALLQHPIICCMTRSESKFQASDVFLICADGELLKARGRHGIKAHVSDGSPTGLQSVVICWALCLTPSRDRNTANARSAVLWTGEVRALQRALSTGSLALLWCLTISLCWPSARNATKTPPAGSTLMSSYFQTRLEFQTRQQVNNCL